MYRNIFVHMTYKFTGFLMISIQKYCFANANEKNLPRLNTVWKYSGIKYCEFISKKIGRFVDETEYLVANHMI